MLSDFSLHRKLGFVFNYIISCSKPPIEQNCSIEKLTNSKRYSIKQKRSRQTFSVKVLSSIFLLLLLFDFSAKGQSSCTNAAQIESDSVFNGSNEFWFNCSSADTIQNVQLNFYSNNLFSKLVVYSSCNSPLDSATAIINGSQCSFTLSQPYSNVLLKFSSSSNEQVLFSLLDINEHQVFISSANGGAANPNDLYCVGDELTFEFTEYYASQYPSTPNPNGITRRIRWFIDGPNGTIQIASTGFSSTYPLSYVFSAPGLYTVNIAKDVYLTTTGQWTNSTEPVYLGVSFTVSPPFPEFELSASNEQPCLGELIDIYSNYIPSTGIQPSQVCWTYSPIGVIGNWPMNACNQLYDNSPLQLNGLTLIDNSPFTVTLVLNNGCSITKSITINPIEPEVEIEVQRLCNFKVRYSANVLNCGEIQYNYQWSFPGGTPSSSSDPNPLVTYPNNSTYTATLTLTDVNFIGPAITENVVVQPVLSSPDYIPPTLEVNNALQTELPSECSNNNLYAITNASQYPGYTFTLSGVQNGTFIAGGGTSWVVFWDNDPNTVSSFVITSTSPEGCKSTHLFELQYCCVEQQSLVINGGDISTWLTANGFTTGTVNLGNTVLVVNGQVNIDVNTTFTNCQNVLLGTNAQLDLQDNVTLTIEDSDFRACGSDLWSGIVSDGPDKNLVAINSTFSDAKCAIRLIKNTVYEIVGCRFYDNWVGIGYLNMTQQSSVVNKCLFQNVNLMKRAVGLQDLLSTIPYQGHFSALNKGTGIYISDCESIVIGEASSIQVRNEFNDLNYGIYVDRSGLEAYNNAFLNINTFFVSGTGNLSFAVYFGTGILIRSTANQPKVMQIGNDGENEGNTFVKCSMGITATESIAGKIIGNTFEDIRFAGIWWTLARRSIDNIIARNNMSSQNGFGVYLNNNPASQFRIEENQISCDQFSPTTFASNYGIYVDGTLAENANNHSRYLIYRNEVNNATHGIVGRSCTRLQIQENRVSNYPATFIPSSQSIYELAGIQVSACINTHIADNLVIGNDDNNSRVKGIDVQECSGPFLQCDSVITCGWAYAFRGANTNSRIVGCKVDDSDYGFVYYNGGFTGPIGHPVFPVGSPWYPQGAPGNVSGNKFWNIGQAHTLSTSINGGIPSNGTLSPWYLPGLNPNNSENPNPAMVNMPLTLAGSFPISIFQVNPFNHPAFTVCQEIDYPLYRSEQEKQWLRKVAVDFEFMQQQDPNTRYLMEEQAYASLKGTPELMENDSVLQAYYQAKEASNSGAFQTIADSIQSRGLLTEEEQQQLNVLRASILPERLQEQNLKTATEIYLRTFAVGSDSLSETDVQTLHSIASTCYFQGGQAVLVARSMLNSRLNVLPVHYADSCQNAYGMQRLAQQKAEKEAEKAIKVYPNPLEKGQPLVITNAAGSYLRIVSVSGKVVLEKTLIQAQEQLTLAERLGSGLYFVQIYEPSGKTQVEKVVVQ